MWVARAQDTPDALADALLGRETLDEESIRELTGLQRLVTLADHPHTETKLPQHEVSPRTRDKAGVLYAIPSTPQKAPRWHGRQEGASCLQGTFVIPTCRPSPARWLATAIRTLDLPEAPFRQISVGDQTP
jgi:hypothetical protein